MILVQGNTFRRAFCYHVARAISAIFDYFKTFSIKIGQNRKNQTMNRIFRISVCVLSKIYNCRLQNTRVLLPALYGSNVNAIGRSLLTPVMGY